MTVTCLYNVETVLCFLKECIIIMLMALSGTSGSCEPNFDANLGKLNFGNCPSSDVFRTTEGANIIKCAEQCMTMSNCGAFDYLPKYHLCQFRNTSRADPVLSSLSGCVSSDINTWTLSHLGACLTRPCWTNEKCVVAKNGDYTCEPVGCYNDPPTIDYSQLVKFATDIGDRAKYVCNENFVSYGNPFITCLNNGTWSSTDFSCFCNQAEGYIHDPNTNLCISVPDEMFKKADGRDYCRQYGDGLYELRSGNSLKELKSLLHNMDLSLNIGEELYIEGRRNGDDIYSWQYGGTDLTPYILWAANNPTGRGTHLAVVPPEFDIIDKEGTSPGRFICHDLP